MGGQRLELPYSQAFAGPSQLAKKIDALAATVPLGTPWTAEKAAEWDAMSLAQWAAKNVINAEELSTLRNAAALTLGTTPDQLSFLYFLFYVHSSGNLHTLDSMEGGAQDSRIEGGSQILSLKMAEHLGEKVRLGAPVKRIVQSTDRVTIETKTEKFSARHLVMALMPGSCTRIQFEPDLPERRRQLQQKWIQRGDGRKFNVVYDQPFWREQGLNGMSSSDTGPVQFTADNSPPDGALGVIALFTTSEGLPQACDERQRLVLDALADIFGERARQAAGFHEVDWGTEQYTAGCVSPLAPGVLTSYGASLRPSVGRIHWVGTETSEVWTGYMDGAICSGRLVAKRLADKLIQA